ncbi:MAG: hypothetical protein IJP03_02645 [Christensenellaceae bacterium]|nr:hypothetical protein [Christensenellaceae bacterium]
MTEQNLHRIRDSLRPLLGRPVQLHAVGERNRILHVGGVLDGVYPRIFTVSVDDGEHLRRYCYAYSEIVTRRVQVTPAI